MAISKVGGARENRKIFLKGEVNPTVLTLHALLIIDYCILIVQWSSTWFSSSNEPFNFWDIIKRFAPLNTIKSIEDMSNQLQTLSGKVSTKGQRVSVIQLSQGRAWIHLVLVQKDCYNFLTPFWQIRPNYRELLIYG